MRRGNDHQSVTRARKFSSVTGEERRDEINRFTLIAATQQRCGNHEICGVNCGASTRVDNLDVMLIARTINAIDVDAHTRTGET